MTAEQIAGAMNAKLVGARLPAISGFSIDSRTLQPGDLFFAIKGPKFDGHDFLQSAFQKGAAGAVVSELRNEISSSNSQLQVRDTTEALQNLAREYRRLWSKTVVAVTGSTGKTTTKTFIAGVLSSRFRVYSNAGNLNNHFGLPLSLLRMSPETDVAVLEMGMSALGEIAALSRIAEPDAGVITNVQPVHLEFFDSVEQIAQAKLELAEYLESRGTWVYNADDPLLSSKAAAFKGKKIAFGTQSSSEIQAQNIRIPESVRTSFVLLAGGSRREVVLPMAGRYFVYNFLAAAAVAFWMGLTVDEIASVAPSLSPVPMRGQIIRISNSATLIDDSYNSNPAALREVAASAATLAGFRRRIAVLGEMLELGKESPRFHYEAGLELARLGFDWIIGVRGNAAAILEGAKQGGVPESQTRYFESSEQAAEFTAQLCRTGDLLLVKGSRGIRMDKVVERLTALHGSGVHS
ncbi:MAG TPA: UDP-N-acetylmuramoyl-tripeptide--D-alanyl-D-alanine ligase [Acidobacteriota bacterium]|jgi:UDP-N-acetylmuramoyl-tripeptide--D-alanyl-D-alanine ligase